MSVYIQDIATLVPEGCLAQARIAEIMKERLATDRRTRAFLHRIYRQSGIEKRHLVLDDVLDETPQTFFSRAMRAHSAPGTGERNALYRKAAGELYPAVAKKLMAGAAGKAARITHVITVSCTGFYAPGPDIDIVKALGLPPSTQRFHIGFMGCYGVFPALRMAQAFCQADPGAAVLVVSVELCTLHIQYKTDNDNLVAASVFADGAAGALVSAAPPGGPAFRLDRFASSLACEGEGDMAWTIGNTGFDMVLSSYVPDLINARLPDVVAPLCEGLGVNQGDVDLWAVHPGGRAVLDKVAQAMALAPEQIAPSREVLADYGNMSSATILFVLDAVRRGLPSHGATVLPIAFGPGLSIETGCFTFVQPDGGAAREV